MGDSRLSAIDVLFNPSLIGKDIMGIHELVYLSISSISEPDKKASLWENIILTGGISGIKGNRIFPF